MMIIFFANLRYQSLTPLSLSPPPICLSLLWKFLTRREPKGYWELKIFPPIEGEKKQRTLNEKISFRIRPLSKIDTKANSKKELPVITIIPQFSFRITIPKKEGARLLNSLSLFLSRSGWKAGSGQFNSFPPNSFLFPVLSFRGRVSRLKRRVAGQGKKGGRVGQN